MLKRAVAHGKPSDINGTYSAILSTAPHITPSHTSSYPILLVSHPLYQTAANWTPVVKAARARTRAFPIFSS